MSRYSEENLETKFSAPPIGGATKLYMPYFVYILRSIKTGKYYTGYTKNLEKRLQRHNSGRTKSLIKHLPLEIIRVEEYKFYEEARKREKEIKKYKSGEAFRKILNL